jgi:predicted acyltransferase
MILGLIAGGVLRSERTPWQRVRWFAIAGGFGLAFGAAADRFGLCPLVKRIWTPAWVLFSGGWCFLLLAGFYAVIDIVGAKRWAFPLMVIGMNSIAAYCMAHLFDGFIMKNLKTNFGQDFFNLFGTAYEPCVSGAATLFVLWLLLFWMYRQKAFLKV